MSNPIEVSIVMPCLNEAETIAICITKTQTFLEKNHISGEIVIGDNGSVDGSQQIAKNLGAVVVHVEQKGYGSATLGAINVARGKYVITADTDDSHDLEHLMPFLNKLREGYDMVMGNRFKGERIPQAMSFLHRYVGNPLLTGIGNLFYKTDVGDFHCGLRGFTKSAFNKMDLKTTGMEFASEIVVKASLNNLKITEVPTTVFPAGRSRKPHLRSFPDGWRHLRFLLLYSPKWLFLLPGFVLMLLGAATSLLLLLQQENSALNWLPLTMVLIVIGFQFCLFYGLTKVYAINHGIMPRPQKYETIFKVFNLEKGLIFGGVCLLLSLVGLIVAYVSSYGKLDSLRIIVPASVFACMGIQIIIFSFFFSILGLGEQLNRK